jgi:uncharacterized cupin superfamily protein
VSHAIVDPESIPAGLGPHPAASPFDKRISQALGITAFEVYQVELPPTSETVRHHHIEDQTEDVYLILRGAGWLVVDDIEVPIEPGQYIAVGKESQRFLRAGADGMDLVAICAQERR